MKARHANLSAKSDVIRLLPKSRFEAARFLSRLVGNDEHSERYQEKVDIGEEYNDAKHVNGLKR
jgi:hypothetical protein